MKEVIKSTRTCCFKRDGEEGDERGAVELFCNQNSVCSLIYNVLSAPYTVLRLVDIAHAVCG
jgi:hypothetical protein